MNALTVRLHPPFVPIAHRLILARSTRVALVANTPLSKYKLSSKPTRTWPPSRTDWATIGICMAPRAKFAQFAPVGNGGACSCWFERCIGKLLRRYRYTRVSAGGFASAGDYAANDYTLIYSDPFL